MLPNALAVILMVIYKAQVSFYGATSSGFWYKPVKVRLMMTLIIHLARSQNTNVAGANGYIAALRVNIWY